MFGGVASLVEVGGGVALWERGGWWEVRAGYVDNCSCEGGNFEWIRRGASDVILRNEAADLMVFISRARSSHSRLYPAIFELINAMVRSCISDGI